MVAKSYTTKLGGLKAYEFWDDLAFSTGDSDFAGPSIVCQITPSHHPFLDWDNMGVSINGGGVTPSHHPFLDWDFPRDKPSKDKGVPQTFPRWKPPSKRSLSWLRASWRWMMRTRGSPMTLETFKGWKEQCFKRIGPIVVKERQWFDKIWFTKHIEAFYMITYG